MAIIDQQITDQYALYNGDSCEVLPSLPANSVHLSIYSPPFFGKRGGLYHYSSSPRDLSNCRSEDEFFEHYRYIVSEIYRLTLPGRITAVHCMDVPGDGANLAGGLIDFPGNIIRLHESLGFQYAARFVIWKEPLAVRNRTMAKGLAHKQVIDDSTLCDNAGADFLLMFRKKGENKIPVIHPTGLESYAGGADIPADLHRFKNWKHDQKENKFSHWIWRRYASSIWDDIRIDRVLPYKEAKDPEDERHVHPLQLDVIERGCVLWSNPGETVLTPFMGVGSEVYGAVINGRKAIGIELKPVYYRQAVCNLETVQNGKPPEQPLQTTIFDFLEIEDGASVPAETDLPESTHEQPETPVQSPLPPAKEKTPKTRTPKAGAKGAPDAGTLSLLDVPGVVEMPAQTPVAPLPPHLDNPPPHGSVCALCISCVTDGWAARALQTFADAVEAAGRADLIPRINEHVIRWPEVVRLVNLINRGVASDRPVPNKHTIEQAQAKLPEFLQNLGLPGEVQK